MDTDLDIHVTLSRQATKHTYLRIRVQRRVSVKSRHELK